MTKLFPCPNCHEAMSYITGIGKSGEARMEFFCPYCEVEGLEPEDGTEKMQISEKLPRLPGWGSENSEISKPATKEHQAGW